MLDRKRKQRNLFDKNVISLFPNDDWLEFAAFEESAEREAEFRLLTEAFHRWLEKQSA